MSALDTIDRAMVTSTLERLGADGWLLFDFHGCNPVAQRLLPGGGLVTRRTFVWIPRQGPMVAIVHKIEMQPFLGFPGTVIPFARHAELQAALEGTLRGKRAAMEISPKDAVPYLDRIPWGVVDLLQSLGVTVVPSADLVTRFAATWSEAEAAEHMQAAELLREIALNALHGAVRRAGTGLTESALQQEVVAAMEAAGMFLTTHPIVGFGPNAANPHYEPRPGADRALEHDQVVLLDLWGGMREGAVFADQTWMGFSGSAVPERVQTVWTTVRDARDAAIARMQGLAASGAPVRSPPRSAPPALRRPRAPGRRARRRHRRGRRSPTPARVPRSRCRRAPGASRGAAARRSPGRGPRAGSSSRRRAGGRPGRAARARRRAARSAHARSPASPR